MIRTLKYPQSFNPTLVRLGYNDNVNVPADRRAAKRPARVTWYCGQIATPGLQASSGIGPQVTPPLTLQFPWDRSQNYIARIVANYFKPASQISSFNEATRQTAETVCDEISELNQFDRVRSCGLDHGPVCTDSYKRMELLTLMQ